MNFKNIVGIGNIYSSEILFDSAIHPFRLSSALSNQEIERLIISIKNSKKSNQTWRNQY